MNLNVLLTASINDYIPGMKGAIILNYVELVNFIKDNNGKLVGAILKDTLTNTAFTVKTSNIVNCTGP